MSLADAEADAAFYKTLAVGLLTELQQPRAMLTRVVRADTHTLRMILLDALAVETRTDGREQDQWSDSSSHLPPPPPPPADLPFLPTEPHRPVADESLGALGLAHLSPLRSVGESGSATHSASSARDRDSVFNAMDSSVGMGLVPVSPAMQRDAFHSDEVRDAWRRVEPRPARCHSHLTHTAPQLLSLVSFVHSTP